MTTNISPLADVDSRAQIADDVEIGPFCLVGPDVTIGDGTRLDSHVSIMGHTSIGAGNRFFANSVIGAEPQDVAYVGSDTRVEIGDDNIFREGVTVNRGADKEDGVTRIGNKNMLMSNAHVAHNCHVCNNVILVNGVLLGGHVHVHDGAIISGNSAIHHFTTVGTMAFVGGCSRCTNDVAPYMLRSGNEDQQTRMVNIVGMQRAGISKATIAVIRRAHRLLFREYKKPDSVRTILAEELDGVIPLELSTLLTFMEASAQGKSGRAREVFRDQGNTDKQETKRRAA